MSRLALKLKINPEYEALVYRPTNEEYIQLQHDINRNGQYYPIIINKSGTILDGHTRYRILNELMAEPTVSIKTFDSKLHEQLFVINANLQRRSLNHFQRITLALKTKPLLEEIAEKNQKAGKPLTQIGERLGRQGVNGAIGKSAKAGHETVRKVEFILKKARKEDIEKLNSGKKTISKIYRKVMKEEKRKQLMQMKPLIELPDGVKLFCSDFREITKKEIKDNSIDLIFSDPPYDHNGISLYRDLAKVAKRVLLDGGCMVVYSGQYYLPQVMEAIQSQGLTWWWCFCSKLNHYHGLVHRRQIYSSWKPILFYVKGDKPKYSTDSIEDFIQSPEPDKALYRYEQSVEEASYIIKHLTVENQIVFDPMMGSGISAIAALANKRKFIGCERDKSIFELSKRRISK